ncbi:MAG: phosphomannomutase/phosphoglucomutase [Bacilli bacterium]
MDTSIFREYDIRGVYPTQVNENVAYQIGRSYGSYIQEKLNKKLCVVGRDNRLSSPSLAKELIKGITESGCDVIDLGLVTTPMYFYGCIKTNVIIGVMVTASHNPKDDNGFKFSFDNLGNARGEQVYNFRDYTLQRKFLNGTGKVTTLEIFPYYKNYIKDNLRFGLRRLKVVVDPGNGTTALFAKDLYSEFNIDLHMICDKSDANFPNHHPDPAVAENLVMLQEEVKRIGADVGIAFDGDGDRVGVVDENGNIVSTDKLMIIFIRSIINQVSNKTFLYDVKCSKALEDAIIDGGGTPFISRTGASYTRANTLINNIPFGGEYSGHLFFNDKWPGFDSGMYCGLRLLEILSNTDQTITDLLYGINEYFNTPEIKIKVTDEIKFKIVEEIKEYCHNKKYETVEIDGVRVKYPDGWALVRASNTGPNLTVRFEATTKKRLDSLKKEFIDLINKIVKK